MLILSAYGTIADRVTDLDAGAQDYLVKPFAVDELPARLRALLRVPRDLIASLPLSSIVDTDLHYLRRKLGRDVVQTVRGLGYRLGPGETP